VSFCYLKIAFLLLSLISFAKHKCMWYYAATKIAEFAKTYLNYLVSLQREFAKLHMFQFYHYLECKECVYFYTGVTSRWRKLLAWHSVEHLQVQLVLVRLRPPRTWAAVLASTLSSLTAPIRWTTVVLAESTKACNVTLLRK